MGRHGIWAFATVVEATIHRHLEYAEAEIEPADCWLDVLALMVSRATDAVICLSTWGASSNALAALKAL